MRVEDLEGALRTAAEGQPPVRSDLGEVTARGRRRQRRRAGAVSALGIGLVVALGVSLVAWTGRTDDDELRTSGAPLATGRWEELPTPPLSPRARVVGVWSGDEVLLVGGDTWLCPPGASCVTPDDPPLSDGAVLDLAAETWRSITPAPVPFSFASTAVLGDEAYFLIDGGAGLRGARAAFLRYSLSEDTWAELPVPPGAELGGLVAAGEVLVAFSGSDEQGEVPDQVFDPASGTWGPLAPDPLSPSFDRSMVWASPYLYLFERELVAQPGSEGPSVTRVARLRPGTEEWERLPDSEIISSSPWYAEGDLLVNPQLGGADGGGNSWGRRYPDGGVLNTTTKVWTDLPEAPSETSTGVVGEHGGLIYGGHAGLLLDLASMTWIDMPAIPSGDDSDDDSYSNRIVVAAGRNAVAFGGEQWSTPEGELLGDAWIWRTASAVESAPPTSDETATTSSTVPTTPTTAGGLCASALDGTELVVGSYLLTSIPPAFEPDGDVVEASTGFVDEGGESHTTQRLIDPDGRWLEFDSYGMQARQDYVSVLSEGAGKVAEMTYRRCIFPASGPEAVDRTLTVAHHPDRTIAATQEDEFGGFAITGGPGVTAETLLFIASGLRTR